MFTPMTLFIKLQNEMTTLLLNNNYNWYTLEHSKVVSVQVNPIGDI